MKRRVEGYWYAAYAPHLPRPVTDVEWPERSEFLTLLDQVETMATKRYTKGISFCRICECGNGNGEFYLDDWMWPEGFSHYLTDHGVRPTADFEAFVRGKTRAG